jgi:alpha-L-rhamnosidase
MTSSTNRNRVLIWQRRRRSNRRRIIHIITLLLSLGWIVERDTLPLAARWSMAPDDQQAHLPLLFNMETGENSNPDFARNLPLWAHDGTPASHEVVLFRHRFTVATTLADARLHIFADTRYEVWVDGQWLGRGPARFSQTRHEYDIHWLGDLAPGDHLVAVLVQWAPNTRRAESIAPHLMAHIEGETADGLQVVARTDSSWRVHVSPAWRQDAAPVHTWQLIGPTELVDLRLLPVDWMAPSISDLEWPYAVPRPLAQNIRYTARSIPLLVDAPMPVAVIDAGVLSPGRSLGQLVPSESLPAAWTFTLHNPATITIETLAALQSEATQRHGSGFSPKLAPELFNSVQDAAYPTVLLNSQPLNWSPADVSRPDVLVTTISLQAGVHTVSFPATPLSEDVVFSVTALQELAEHPPFTQSTHAGRRLLLAEPANQAGMVVDNHSADDTLSLTITSTPAYAVLDLGRVVHGRLEATVTGPAGAVIDIGWDERLLAGTMRPLPYPGSLHAEWNQVDSWVLDGSARTIRTIDARAGRYVLIATWGGAPVELHNLQVREERAPVNQRGWFRSSNPRLDQIWQLGVDTLYPSLQDAYADPWRERGQWWGDAYVTDHVNQVAFGETYLLRRGLLFMAESLRNGQPTAFAPNGDAAQLLDYSMLWAQSLHDYLVLTDERPFVRRLYPALTELMAYLATRRHPDTGLLDIAPGHWSQTALIDWVGNASRTGQSTALNALYYKTLLDAAVIAERLLEPVQATAWRQQATAVKEQINQTLYLADQGRYLASILADVPVAPTTHAQAWALAFAVPTPEWVDSVATALLDPFRAEIFGMFWVLEGLANAGRMAEAVQLVEERYGRLLDQGATTLWEGWESNLHYRAALSHSWGGAPTWFLTTHILGARRTGPDQWAVQPAFAGVDWAAGALPLSAGDLLVEWHDLSCTERSLTVSAPTGSDGEILLPAARLVELKLNSLVAWAGGTALSERVQVSDGLIRIGSAGGVDQIEMALGCAG